MHMLWPIAVCSAWIRRFLAEERVLVLTRGRLVANRDTAERQHRSFREIAMQIIGEKGGGRGRRMAVILALGGMAFCVLAAIGAADVLCVSSGCGLYRDWNVFGFSLWWYGAGAFMAIATLGVFSPSLALVLAGVALFLDVVLLGAMALLAPCGNCLIAGGVFFLVWFFLRGVDGKPGAMGTVLMVLWFAALSPNLLALLGEGGGWAVSGDEHASVRVYFSPSCPACIRAVDDLTAVLAPGAAFVPVSERPSDVERIIAMDRAVQAGTPFRKAFYDAVQPEFEPLEHGVLEYLRYRVLVARNHAAHLRMGAQAVPTIVTTGWRGRARAKPAPAAREDAPIPSDAGAAAPPSGPSVAPDPSTP